MWRLIVAMAFALLYGSAACAQNGAAGMLLERAAFWEGRGRDDLALAELDKVLRLAPGQPDALAGKALAQQRLGRTADAAATAALLRAAAPRHPGLAQYRGLLRQQGPDARAIRDARGLARTGRVDQALSLYRQLDAREPLTGDLALEYWQLVGRTAGGYDRAIAGTQRLVREHPQHPGYLLALARLEFERQVRPAMLEKVIRIAAVPRYRQEARDVWRKGLLRLPASAASLALIDDYLAMQETEDTAMVAQRARLAQGIEAQRRLAADPGWQARGRGLAALASGRLDDAQAALREALRIRPRDPDVLGGLGTIHLRRGEHARAEAYFADAQRTGGGGRWQAMARVARFWGLMRAARDAMNSAEYGRAADLLAQARALDPREPAGLLAEADLAGLRGDPERAGRLFREALSKAPKNEDVLAGMAGFLMRQGDQAAAAPLLAALPAARRAELDREITRLRTAALVRDAEAAAARADDAAAIALYEEAAALDPADPWLRRALAGRYAARGEPERGRALFDALLERQPDDPATRYAYALFLGSQGREAEAADQLRAIPAARRSAEVAAQLARLDVAAIGARARVSGDREAALATLREALGRYGSEPARVLDIASAMAAIGVDEEALRALSVLDGSELDADALAARRNLETAIAVRRAARLREAGDTDNALRALAVLPETPAVLAERARIERARGDTGAALATLRQWQAASPQDAGAAAAIAELLAALGDRAGARAQAKTVLALADAPPDALADAAGVLIALDEAADLARADVALRAQLERHPAEQGLLDRAGTLAERAGRIDDAIGFYRRGNAVAGPVLPDWRRDRLAGLVDRRAGWVSSAVDHQTRTGTPGRSDLAMDEWVAEYRLPQAGPDRMALRADVVSARAGALDTASPATRDAGTILLCQPGCAPARDVKEAGVALNAAWARGPWRADLGTTPLGFPVTSLLGGVSYRGDIGPAGWGIELSRRALAASVLSYAGMRDPGTGRTWGGVTVNGATLSGSLDQGGLVGGWANLGWHVLAGKHVQSNRRVQGMAGVTVRIINERHRLLSVGATAMAWNFSRNAGEYSFGHGGYYSPAAYRSLSLPVTWGQRFGAWAVALRASISASRSSTKDAPFYPLDAALQAEADAVGAAAFYTPRYAGGKGRGTGRGLALTWEYQAGRALFVGGRLSLDRSIDYAPNRFLLYLRWAPGHVAAQPVAFPPEPVVPTSQL